ncbi:hypothetical protein EJB05_15153, partial [Eragrostis curvula]
LGQRLAAVVVVDEVAPRLRHALGLVESHGRDASQALEQQVVVEALHASCASSLFVAAVHGGDQSIDKEVVAGRGRSIDNLGVGSIRKQVALGKKTSEKAVPQPFCTQEVDSDVHDTSFATMNQIPGDEMGTSRLSQYEQGSCLDYLGSLYNNPQLHVGYTDLLMEQIRNSQEEKNGQQAQQVSGCLHGYEMFGGLHHNNSEEAKHNLDSTQCGAYKGTFTELLLADNPMVDHYGLETGISEDNDMLFNNYSFVNTSAEYGQTNYEATLNAQEASSIEGSSVQHEQNNQSAYCETWGPGIFDAMNLQEAMKLSSKGAKNDDVMEYLNDEMDRLDKELDLLLLSDNDGTSSSDNESDSAGSCINVESTDTGSTLKDPDRVIKQKGRPKKPKRFKKRIEILKQKKIEEDKRKMRKTKKAETASPNGKSKKKQKK